MSTAEMDGEKVGTFRRVARTGGSLSKKGLKYTSEELPFLVYKIGLRSCGEIQSCKTELDLLSADFEFLGSEYADCDKAANKLNIANRMLKEANSALKRVDTISFWRYYSLARMWELHAARDFDLNQDKSLTSGMLQERIEDILVEASRLLDDKQLSEVNKYFFREDRSIKDVETGIQKVYDQYMQNTRLFLQRRVISKQFEFFVFSTIMSLMLIHYVLHLDPMLLSQDKLEPLRGSSYLLIAAISLFGILGASVSSLLSLSDILSNDSLQISKHVGDLRLAFGRIMLGWAGAMIVYAFLLSGVQTVLVLTYGGVLLVAFASGFTERLLLKAVQRISGEVDGNEGDGNNTDISDRLKRIEQVLSERDKPSD